MIQHVVSLNESPVPTGAHLLETGVPVADESWGLVWQPLAIWIAAAGATLALGAAAGVETVAAVAVAVVVALVALRSEPRRLGLTLIALVPLGLEPGGAGSGWVLAGAALALATVVPAQGLVRRGPATEARRHLAACRRRDAAADVLVVRAAGLTPSTARRLLGTLRCSDSGAVVHARGDTALIAVLDRDELVRSGVEARLRDASEPHAPAFGWSSFPEDGLTLEVLVEHALATAPPVLGSPSGRTRSKRLALAGRSS